MRVIAGPSSYGSACHYPRLGVQFDDVWFSYPTAQEVSLASLEDVAVLDEDLPGLVVGVLDDALAAL